MSEADAKGCPVGAGDASYDPFEEFNRAQGIGHVEDPYTDFKEKRGRCPVHPVEASFLSGGQDLIIQSAQLRARAVRRLSLSVI